MTEYYIHMEAEERLPAFFPRFNYYCAYKNMSDDEE